ncbi:MAG: hypothetical protein Q8N48_02595 [Thiobacillus sp.]|nr:hypothetical protein [Thiobacillus sp.]MDP2977698.1 hypothetical protein [Thiobacillus sp.]
MPTFAPFLADSLEGFNKVFLSFLVNKGLQDLGHTKAGIKGGKVRKPLSALLTLYSCQVCGWVIAGLTRAAAEAASGMACVCSIDPTPKRYLGASTHAGSLGLGVSLGFGFGAYATSLPNGVTP